MKNPFKVSKGATSTFSPVEEIVRMAGAGLKG